MHLLRTERWPFLQSRAAWPLQLSSFSTMLAGIVMCYIPGLAGAFQLTEVPHPCSETASGFQLIAVNCTYAP